MKSRGPVFGLGAVARRSLALLWTAVLLCSIVLQYVAVATPSAVLAADTPDKPATSLAAPNGWTGGANALNGTDDGVAATATGDNVDQGFRDFSFGIPAGSIITGITVRANAYSSDSDGCQLSFRVSWDGSNWSNRQTVNLNGDANAVVIAGSASDTWGHVWDPTQTTNGSFGLEVRNEDPGSACSGTTALDWVTVAARYETIGNGTANAALTSELCDAADFNFVIDMSGSIGAQGSNPSNLPDLKAGITGFVTAFQNAGGDGRYSGTRFNDGAASTLTNGYVAPNTFTGAVNGLGTPDGFTPTSIGINTGAGNNGNDRSGVPNVMFVVTDGSPNQPNTHGNDTNNPDTWLQGANAAITAANGARAGSGASKYIVKAVYLSTAGDPGDTSMPFSAAGKVQWPARVMDEIGGGSHLDADFKAFVDDLFKAISCPPPSLEITKTADDATVNAGAQIGFKVTVNNKGGKPANGVVVADNLPDSAGTDWSIAADSDAGCSISGAPGNESLSCDFGTLAAGAKRTVHVVSGTGAACGKYDNTATLTSSNAGEGQASASVTVRCAGIDIEKVADAGSASAGDPIGFLITVKSTGAAPATGVTVTDTLPTDAGLAWSIDGGSAAGSCQISAGVLSCALGTMAPDATRTVHISSPTSQATLATSPVTNTAKVTTTNDGSDEDTDEVQLLAGSIDIEKVADTPSVSAGDKIGFTITVSSNGPGKANGVAVIDTLPSDAGTSWSIDGGTAAGACQISAGVLSCALGDLANGQVRTVHISSPTTKGTVADSPVVNTAKVTTTNDGSDQDTDKVDVLGASIDVEKVADAGSVSAGDKIGFAITVTSGGPGVAKGVQLTDTLPADAGTTWTIDGGNAAGSCQISAGVLSCALGDLVAGATRTVHVSSPTTKATVADSPVVNTASVTTTNDGSDSDTDQVVVLGASIDIEKVADAGSVSAGDKIGFTITVASNGPGAAKGVTVSDTLPTDAGTAWTIDGGTGAAQCSIAGGALACDFGQLAAGETRTVHLASPTTKATIADSPVANTASVTTSNDGSDSDTDQVVVLGPDIVVEKDGNGTISAGDKAQYVITVRNVGDGVARNVTLSDTLPAGIAWSTPTPGCSIEAGVLSCSFGDLGHGGSAAAVVSGETDAEDCHALPNTASAAAANEAAAQTGNNSDSATITVNCPLVAITKTPVDPVVDATGQIGFDVTVTNTGLGNAFGVTVTDTLPTDAGLAWSIDAAHSDAGWTIEDGVLAFGPATLGGGQSTTVRIVSLTTPATCGTVHNVAFLTYQGGSGDDDGDIKVNCPDVTISKTAGTSPVLAGQAASFTISAWNTGKGAAHDVVITDKLPAGIDWKADNDACAIADGVLTCQVGTLAEGDEPFTVVISGTTSIEECGSLDNLAEVSASNEPASASENNQARASVTVQCASVTIVKTAGEAADGDELLLEEPGNVVFTYVVTNTGAADLVDLSLVDDNATPGNDADDVAVECPADELAAGESMTCHATLPVDYGTRTNVATVTGSPALDPEAHVSATDDAVVRVPEPEVIDLAFQKLGVSATYPAPVRFQYVITNPGTKGLSGVTLDDSLPSSLTWSIAPAGAQGGIEPVCAIWANEAAFLAHAAPVAGGNYLHCDLGLAPGSQLDLAAADLPQAEATTFTLELVTSKNACTPNKVGSPATVTWQQGRITRSADATALVKATCPVITPPPTSTEDADSGEVSSTNGLLLVILGIVGLTLVLGYLVPVPAHARRRRNRRG